MSLVSGPCAVNNGNCLHVLGIARRIVANGNLVARHCRDALRLHINHNRTPLSTERDKRDRSDGAGRSRDTLVGNFIEAFNSNCRGHRVYFIERRVSRCVALPFIENPLWHIKSHGEESWPDCATIFALRNP